MTTKLTPELKRHIEKETSKRRVREAMSSIIEEAHSGDSESVISGLLEALTGSHRTIQQETCAILHETLKQYSKQSSDARNQASIDWAKNISEIDAYFPYI